MNNNLSNNKFIWIILIVFGVGLIGTAIRIALENSSKPPSSNKQGQSVTQQGVYFEIDFGTGKRAFEGEILKDMSILDALIISSQIGNFEIGYNLSNDKLSLSMVDGLKNEGFTKKWNFYLNGQLIDSYTIHKAKVMPGDKILLRLE